MVAPPIANTDEEPEVIVILPKPPVPKCVSRLPLISTPLVPDSDTVAPVVPEALVALILKFAAAVATVN